MHKDFMYISDRPDGRFKDSWGSLHYYLKNLEQELAFDPHLSKDNFLEWQSKVRSKLLELMCFPRKVQTQPQPKFLWEEGRNGYRLQKWETYPEPGFVIPVLILVPNEIDKDNPGPAVLCIPGSSASKELLAGEPEVNPLARTNKHPEHNKMALWYVRAGMIAVAVDNPDLGEALEFFERNCGPRNARTRSLLADIMIFSGRSYLGFSVFQKMKIIEWLRTLDFIDPKRIAVSGMSLGTEPAMVLGILDKSICAMVFNDCLTNTKESFIARGLPYIGVWHTVPGMLKWFDFPDLLAAFAPRPLLLPEGGIVYHLKSVRRAYAILGEENNFTVEHYPKYRNAEARKHDSVTRLPEGLTREDFFEYANVDVSSHYFKEDVAVPWLKNISFLSSKVQSSAK